MISYYLTRAEILEDEVFGVEGHLGVSGGVLLGDVPEDEELFDPLVDLGQILEELVHLLLQADSGKYCGFIELG